MRHFLVYVFDFTEDYSGNENRKGIEKSATYKTGRKNALLEKGIGNQVEPLLATTD